MIVDLDLSDCGTDLDKVSRRARSLGLSAKASREVCHCWDVLQIWRDWFEGKFGELKLIRHRSQPDDPPDIELVFARQTVACEETRLLPEHIGRADALRDSEIAPDVCTNVPAISEPRKTNKELIEKMLSMREDELWTDVAAEHLALGELLSETIRNKMNRLPQDGGVIVITDAVAIMGSTLDFLFEAAEALVKSEKFKDFDNYILIVQSRPNTIKYRCALITRSAGKIMRTDAAKA